jgi:hypothetical protein
MEKNRKGFLKMMPFHLIRNHFLLNLPKRFYFEREAQQKRIERKRRSSTTGNFQ